MTPGPSDPTPAPTPPTDSLGGFHADTDYMPGCEGEAQIQVQYLAWLIRNTITHLLARQDQADAEIIALHATVDKQSRAINKLTVALQDLRKEAKKPAPTPTPAQPDKWKGKTDTPTTDKTTALMKKTYANAASNSNTSPPADFTKVTYEKKKAKTPFFTPEYTRLNRQVIVETSGQIPELISNDNILEVVNEATMAPGLKFHSAQRSTNGNLRFETNPATSADQGAKYHVEITFALEKLHIQATNVYVNSRWSKFGIHGVPAHIGTRNRPELSSLIAEEIFQSTNFSMAEPPRWLTCPASLENRGSGTIIVSFPGKVENLGMKLISLFNRRY
ncbi:hypothetical protein Q9L58_009368 [Maublancomyces gigas]|uniref:Uncharacterized protein n=1 Tax=Discina gigas TaxID=1032678 RepID=A0ABR3G759_9PEZI